jgi:hypothetical protein
MDDIYKLGNTTGVCSASAIEEQVKLNGVSDTFLLVTDFLGALFQTDGEEVLKGANAAFSAVSQYTTVYYYFWISLLCVLICSMIFLQLVRKKRKADLFDFVGMITRSLGCIICIVLVSLASRENNDVQGSLLTGPYIVPIAVLILFGVLCGDQFSRVFCTWRLKRQGPFPDGELRGHGHQHEHGERLHEEGSKYTAFIAREDTSTASMLAPGFSRVFPMEESAVHFPPNGQTPRFEYTAHE